MSLRVTGRNVAYRTHAPHLNPTKVFTLGGNNQRWPEVIVDDAHGLQTQIVGVTIKALMDALIEDPITRRYLGTGVDHFRTQQGEAA